MPLPVARVRVATVEIRGLTATEEVVGTVPHVLSVAAFQRGQLEYVVGACVVLLPRKERP